MIRRLFVLLVVSLTLFAWIGTATPRPFTAHARSTEPQTTTAADPTLRADLATWKWQRWSLLSPALQAKVDPRILAELRGEFLPAHLGGALAQAPQRAPRQPRGQTRFLIYLQTQPDPAHIAQAVVASQIDQRRALVQTLRSQTQAQQAPLRSFLDREQALGTVQGYQPFYIVNALAAEGGIDLILDLVQRPDVARLVANYPLQPFADPLAMPEVATVDAAPPQHRSAASLDESNWNIELVGADRVWRDFALRGEGAVVAGFDTGVNFRHPALLTRYRGYRGNNRFDHNYNWFEPDGNLYPNGDLGPSLSREPTTCGSHGTHTLGTMVGDGGVDGTQVGMAPGATWIALPGICGNTMGGGLRDDIGGIKAFQWLLCPTDLSGTLATADCSQAPDVVNNSWGAANPAVETFRPLIQALRAANIAPVFAAGNPHITDGSIGSPAGAPEAITVGATDRDDRVAPFSGRGPSFYPNEQKPELSAPGVDIKSAVEGSDYNTLSGTSMAAPHVAGLIALMVSADWRDGVRDFTVDELESFLQSTAVDLGPTGPDVDYGYGRIDAYNAVRLVLRAGDLRGTARDAQTTAPIGAATMTAVAENSNVVQTNAQGSYSLTVPAGIYQLQVDAWGYASDRFANQTVLANALAVADFTLQPLPRTTLSGQVRGNRGAVAGARVYVAAAPTVQALSDSDGRYQLALPHGLHQLVIEKAGYRRQTVALQVDPSTGANNNVVLDAAPTILLVEADAYRGWFNGWPIGEFFRSALSAEGYLYTDWPIQYADQTDTLVLADGSTGYGRPSLATLAQYDLVIWAQSACNSGVQGCFIANSPTRLGADEALRHYLDQGGRLLLSGQDLGGWEDGLPLFTDYLHTALVADRAASTGSTLTGSGFLSGLQITLTNASLYGYANGSLQLAPDAVVAEAGAPTVYPILTYDDSQLPAALAIDPCAADYRAAYFAVGYENIARRGKEQDPAFSALLGRTVAWLAGARRTQDVELVVEKPLRFGAPGAAVTVPVQLINTGRQPLTLQLRFDGNQWPVSLQRAGEALPAQLQLAPCRRIDLTAVTAIPSSAVRDAGDIVTLTLEVSAVDGTPLPALTQRAEVATTVFPTWQVAPLLPTPRYQQATVALPGVPGERAGQLYAIGGWADGGDSSGGNVVAQTTNERFDSCTGQWQTLAALPAPRAAAAVATIAGDLYVVGGRAAVIGTFGSATQPFANLWRYDVAADRWQERAPLPVALSGAAAIGLGDSLYLFGGVDNGGVLRNLSYRYDVATDRWHELAPIPGPGRLFAAVAQVGEELFLVGGYPALSLVHRYDPAHNRWQAGPPLRQGRHSFGLARTPGGELYAVGGAVGDEGLASVERLVAGVWQLMPALQLPYRNGVGAAYVDGAVVAVGGAGSQGGSELLAVDPAFCRSTIGVDTSVAGTGKPLLYTIQLQGDTVALPNARLHNRLPPATRFVGFVDNALNARYDVTSHAIDWQGALAAHATLPAIRYQLTSDQRELTTGDRLTNTVTFAHGTALTFTRQAPVALLSTALANSFKAVDQARVRSGALLTYTIAIQGESYVSNTVTVRDPLPPLLSYVPDSLRYIGGRGGYDAATRSIWWEGSTATTGAPFANVQDRYLWGDNRTDFTGIGGGPVGGGAAGGFAVFYQWLPIQESGTAVGNGDDVYFCELPIGFAFPFYGKNETTFCVSTNGFLSFDPLGDAGDTTPICPLPDRNGNRGMIAAIWDDLIVGDAIYYQTFGSAPHRYLVVQWQDVHRFGALTAQSANFQLVLMEDGQIRLAIEKVGTLRGTFSLTGVADPSRTQATTYACRGPGRLYNQQAILFLPPGGTTNVAAQTIQFQAQIGGNGVAVGVNLPVTNTAYISASAPTLPSGPLQRHVTTLLNPLDLTSSRLAAERAEVAPQETIAFTLTLRNTGLVSATAATAVITLPTALTVEAGTVHCVSGACRGDGAQVTWQGTVAPQANQLVHFIVRLTQPQPDRTPLLVTAQINDGFGKRYPRQLTLSARRADLSPSRLDFQPRFGEPGTTTLLVALLQNVGKLSTQAVATITLPSQLPVVAGSLRCGTGSCVIDDGVIHWTGIVAPRTVIPIQVRLAVPTEAAYGLQQNAQLALAEMDWSERYSTTAAFQVMHTYLLPIVFGANQPHRLYLPWVAKE